MLILSADERNRKWKERVPVIPGTGVSAEPDGPGQAHRKRVPVWNKLGCKGVDVHDVDHLM
jgi:hypothetical protein